MWYCVVRPSELVTNVTFLLVVEDAVVVDAAVAPRAYALCVLAVARRTGSRTTARCGSSRCTSRCITYSKLHEWPSASVTFTRSPSRPYSYRVWTYQPSPTGCGSRIAVSRFLVVGQPDFFSPRRVLEPLEPALACRSRSGPPHRQSRCGCAGWGTVRPSARAPARTPAPGHRRPAPPSARCPGT